MVTPNRLTEWREHETIVSWNTTMMGMSLVRPDNGDSIVLFSYWSVLRGFRRLRVGQRVEFLRGVALLIACTFSICVSGCSHITHSVTKTFPTEVLQDWCLTTDVFIVSSGDCWGCAWMEGRPSLLAEAVGSRSDLPKSAADFHDHPTDWYHQPSYPFIPKPADVRAAFPKGSRFRIVKVVEVHGPIYDQGTTLRPEIAFEAPNERLGRIDAWWLLARLDDATKLQFKAAAPCSVQP
jgi:hypothetical protein